jgi:hypothetical protein
LTILAAIHMEVRILNMIYILELISGREEVSPPKPSSDRAEVAFTEPPLGL